MPPKYPVLRKNLSVVKMLRYIGLCTAIKCNDTLPV